MHLRMHTFGSLSDAGYMHATGTVSSLGEAYPASAGQQNDSYISIKAW